MNQRIILILVLILVGINGFAQTFDEKIERVIEIQQELKLKEYWTMMISRIIEANTENNPNLSEKDIEELKEEVLNNELEKINSDILAITKKHYTEKDIDALLGFYESSIGQKLRKVSEEYYEDLMKFEDNTTERLRNEVVKVINSNEAGNKNIETVKILTGKYLELNEDNEQSIVIDFGDVTGQRKVIQIVKIKNTSKRDIVLGSSFSHFLLDERKKGEITIDFGNKIVKPNEIREIKFILDAHCVQGRTETSTTLGTGIGKGISYKLTYYSEGNQINFSITNDKLMFEKFESSFSENYKFKIKNTGFSDISIKDVRFSSKVIYVNYNQELVPKGEETEINVIYSKELMKKYRKNEINSTIEVDIQRCNNGHSWETIQLKIEK